MTVQQRFDREGENVMRKKRAAARSLVGACLAIFLAVAAGFDAACAAPQAHRGADGGGAKVTHPRVAAPQASATDPTPKLKKSDRDWRKLLTVQQFNIMRKAGTEPAFQNRYWDFHGDGLFVCAGCGLELFDAKTKFESGTGWPSFWQPISANRVAEKTDKTYGMVRVEVLCARCDAHLGHVFNDGPRPTGLRYCMNSASMTFVERAAADAAKAADKTADGGAAGAGGN